MGQGKSLGTFDTLDLSQAELLGGCAVVIVCIACALIICQRWRADKHRHVKLKEENQATGMTPQVVGSTAASRSSMCSRPPQIVGGPDVFEIVPDEWEENSLDVDENFWDDGTNWDDLTLETSRVNIASFDG